MGNIWLCEMRKNYIISFKENHTSVKVVNDLIVRIDKEMEGIHMF